MVFVPLRKSSVKWTPTTKLEKYFIVPYIKFIAFLCKEDIEEIRAELREHKIPTHPLDID